jgi:hypothetical protein
MPPVIEMPKGAAPAGKAPDELQVPSGRDTPAPLLKRGASRFSRLRNTAVAGVTVPRADSAKVAQISVNKTLTGGYCTDGSGNPEGLLVVVEPRDVSGNIMDAAGDVNIALFDPALPAESMKVASWNLTAGQTAGMFVTGPDQGMHLNLPWPSSPPRHSNLKAVVRYTTRDGRKLQIERPVEVAQSAAADRLPAEGPVLESNPSSTESWRRSTTPRSDGSFDPSPMRTATRPTDSGPQRPVWSPERLY